MKDCKEGNCSSCDWSSRKTVESLFTEDVQSRLRVLPSNLQLAALDAVQEISACVSDVWNSYKVDSSKVIEWVHLVLDMAKESFDVVAAEVKQERQENSN